MNKLPCLSPDRLAAGRRATVPPAALLPLLLMLGCGLFPKPPQPWPTPTPAPTPGPTPTPAPTPEPGLPPKGTPVLLDLLLRQDAPRLLRGGQPFTPSGATQCCMATEIGVAGPRIPRRPRAVRVAGVPVNSRWPSISTEVQDFFAAQGGANFFAIRVAPYLGDADHESEWADIGGPVSVWPEFNQAWWDENRKIIYHAGSVLKANVQVEWDAWYGKTCKNNSQPCAWPESEQVAWGEVFTAGHKRFIDKIVEEFGCFGNVVWQVDNEGALVPRAKREYYEAVHWAFRDAEQKLGCGIVHMTGINWPEVADGPYDYVTTHADAPLTRPFWGKHSQNNEHNNWVSVENDFSRFCEAQAAGLHYWYWRAEDSDAEMRAKLAKRKAGCGSSSAECFAPPPDDPNWGAASAGGDPVLRSGIESAKLAVGERCGAADKYATLGVLATELRERGYCAYGPWADALAVVSPDGQTVHEYHSVAFTDGCWAGQTTPKMTWHYNGTLPKSTSCPQSVPVVDEILCKPHPPIGTYDCTPKHRGQPILPEGDPQRRACELKAMGGADPSYTLHVTAGNLTLNLTANPMQVKVTGSGTGQLRCEVPAVNGGLCNTTVTR